MFRRLVCRFPEVSPRQVLTRGPLACLLSLRPGTHVQEHTSRNTQSTRRKNEAWARHRQPAAISMSQPKRTPPGKIWAADTNRLVDRWGPKGKAIAKRRHKVLNKDTGRMVNKTGHIGRKNCGPHLVIKRDAKGSSLWLLKSLWVKMAKSKLLKPAA